MEGTTAAAASIRSGAVRKRERGREREELSEAEQTRKDQYRRAVIGGGAPGSGARREEEEGKESRWDPARFAN